MEQQRREERESRKRQRDRAGEGAEKDREPAEEFERDGGPGEDGRHAARGHVGGKARHVLKLAIARDDEKDAEEEARQKGGAGGEVGHRYLRFRRRVWRGGGGSRDGRGHTGRFPNRSCAALRRGGGWLCVDRCRPRESHVRRWLELRPRGRRSREFDPGRQATVGAAGTASGGGMVPPHRTPVGVLPPRKQPPKVAAGCRPNGARGPSFTAASFRVGEGRAMQEGMAAASRT